MAYCSQYVLLEKGHQDEPLPSADRLPAGREGCDALPLAPFLHFPEQVCSLECARRKESHTQKDITRRFLPGACWRDLGMPMCLPALQRPRFNSPGQERHGIDCVCIPFYRWANGNQPGKDFSRVLDVMGRGSQEKTKYIYKTIWEIWNLTGYLRLLIIIFNF